MPRSSDPSNYPPEYMHLVKQAAIDNKITKVHFATVIEARRAYSNYYSGFVGAMNKVRRRVEEKRVEPNMQEQEWLTNLALCRRVMVQIEKRSDGGADLVWMNKSMSTFGQAVRNATVIEGGSIKPLENSEEAAMLDRLKGLATPEPRNDSSGPIIPEMEKSDEVKEKTSKYGRREG